MADIHSVMRLRDRGRHREAAELAERLMEGCADDVELMGLLKTRGYIFKGLDRLEEAEADFRRALELFDGSAGLREAVLCRRGLALLKRGRPHLGASLAEHRRELELAERLEDPRILCGTLANLANVHIRLAGYGKARDCAERQLACAEELGDRRMVGLALSNLGRALMFLGETRRARQRFEAQLAMAEASGEPQDISNALNNLSMLEMERGAPEAALPHLQRQLELGRESSDRNIEMVSRGNLAVCLRRLGRHREALEQAKEQFRLSWEKSDWMNMAAALGNMGEVYIHLGELDRALQCIENLVRNAETGGVSDAAAGGLLLKAGLQLALGRREEAFGPAKRASRIFDALGLAGQAAEARATALAALPAGDGRAAALLGREPGPSTDGPRGEQRLAVQRARHGGSSLEELAEALSDPLARAEALAACGRRAEAVGLLRKLRSTRPLDTGPALLLIVLEEGRGPTPVSGGSSEQDSKGE